MRKVLLAALAVISSILLPSCGPKSQKGPVPVCHLLICCRSMNSGSTFLVQDKWNPAHDYKDIDQVRDILQKVKDAGINVVSVDFTNPPEWEMGEGGQIHLEGVNPAWSEFGLMLDNIVTVCHEKDMEFLIFIGNPAAWTMKYWNQVAGFVWERYAQDPAYRHYGFGDDRPLMVVFLPGESFWPLWENTPDEEKNNLANGAIGILPRVPTGPYASALPMPGYLLKTGPESMRPNGREGSNGHWAPLNMPYLAPTTTLATESTGASVTPAPPRGLITSTPPPLIILSSTTTS